MHCVHGAKRLQRRKGSSLAGTKVGIAVAWLGISKAPWAMPGGGFQVVSGNTFQPRPLHDDPCNRTIKVTACVMWAL